MSADIAPRPQFVAAPPLPEFVQIEPVGQCNLRCQMCAIQFRRDGPPHGPLAFMAFETFTRLLDQFPRLRELHLQGLGEPTMHPRFFDMVAHAAARGIRVSTNSNLTLWSERRALQCAQSGLAELSVSLDAADPSIYERIRRGAHFGKVLRNLRRVMAARAATRSPLEVRIVMVLMKQNLDDLPNLVRLAAAEGVGSVFVQHLCHDFEEGTLPSEYKPIRSFIHDEMLDRVPPARVEEVFAAARAAAQDNGVRLRLPRLSGAPAPRAEPPRCDWPWRGSYISYAGDAMPCCMVGTPDRASFGNMAREGVAAVWNNDGYRAFREQLASSSPPAICRSCSLYRGTF
ncbi:MAG TPA: radical SAM protein [Casimicrobiaceae bacterium]|jgi:radical SAM protein with 4Fe4S-binding SPASM domain|nr:radical SAM protein [Casimicrobiaceae bacterium]